MAPLTINVNGNSSIHRRAERAVMTINVSFEDASQELVSTTVRETSNSLKTLLRSLSPRTPAGEIDPEASITQWSNRSITTSSRELRDDQRNSIGRLHTAQTNFEIKFRDFEKLGEVATQLSTMPHVAISGIQWRLTDETRKSLASRSRREAMANAVEKAEDYFASIFSSGGKIEAVEITEGHSMMANQRAPHARAHFAAMRPPIRVTKASAVQEEDEGLDFQPEDVEITSAVSVKFVSV